MRTPTLEITRVIRGETVWLRLDGDLDRMSVPDFNRALAAAERMASTVIVDANGIAFVDAGGLFALISAARRARQSGHRRLLVVNPSAPLRRLLEVTGTDRAITIGEPG